MSNAEDRVEDLELRVRSLQGDIEELRSRLDRELARVRQRVCSLEEMAEEEGELD